MNSVLAEVAKAQREKTPFCERFIEFLQAGLLEVVDCVNYNIIAWQEEAGVLRTERQYDHYGKTSMARPRFDANEQAIMQNKSDAAVLGKLAVFKAENSLDMDEEAEQWFEYITTGQRGTAMQGGE